MPVLLSLRVNGKAVTAEVAPENARASLTAWLMSLVVSSFFGNVIYAIAADVGLAFLGFENVTTVSWGTMLAEAQAELILGYWWQLATATVFMAVFVTAFSLMADAWRDALDPKLRGR